MTTQATLSPYNGARFLYVREAKDSNVVTTFAYKFDDENNRVTFAKAKCSKKDRYERAIGRGLAFQRLENGLMLAIPYSRFDKNTPSFRGIAGILSKLA